MLTGLKHSVKAGQEVPVTLDFAETGKVDVKLPAAPMGATTPAGSGGWRLHDEKGAMGAMGSTGSTDAPKESGAQ